jgi:hypothetical protein
MTVAAAHTINMKSIGILLSQSGPGRRGWGDGGGMTAGTEAPGPGKDKSIANLEGLRYWAISAEMN